MPIHASAHGFDRAADDYDRARPGYPAEAGTWLARRLDLRAGRTVLDLAAGTGKLTRLLLRTGARVIAVEPLAGMRSRLVPLLPERDLLDGTAEELPVADSSVDAVTIAQAFHWFAGERALSEIHRVTRQDSRLAVVYNRRPLEHPLQKALEAIVSPHRGDTPSHHSGAWRDAFDRTELWAPSGQLEMMHSTLMTREDIVARVASTSFISSLPGDRRDDVRGQVRTLVAAHDEPIELPYVCELFLWRRL